MLFKKKIPVPVVLPVSRPGPGPGTNSCPGRSISIITWLHGPGIIFDNSGVEKLTQFDVISSYTTSEFRILFYFDMNSIIEFKWNIFEFCV